MGRSHTARPIEVSITEYAARAAVEPGCARCAVPLHEGNRPVSDQETYVPKRRSSAASRRRRAQLATPVAPATQTVSTQPSTAVAEAEAAEKLERHLQRRDERKAAKSKKVERKGVAKVVDTKRLNGVQKFYNDTMSEIRKVNWPDRQQTINLTLLVIALSIVLGTLLGGLDFVLLRMFEAIG